MLQDIGLRLIPGILVALMACSGAKPPEPSYTLTTGPVVVVSSGDTTTITHTHPRCIIPSEEMETVQVEFISGKPSSQGSIAKGLFSIFVEILGLFDLSELF